MADAKRFKELVNENGELKKMLADEMLKNRGLNINPLSPPSPISATTSAGTQVSPLCSGPKTASKPSRQAANS